jgi:hypothetical protein
MVDPGEEEEKLPEVNSSLLVLGQTSSLYNPKKLTTETSFSCHICCEEFDGSVPHYTCPGNPSSPKAHGPPGTVISVCVTCFSDFIKFCCANSAAMNTIPVTCSMPSCKVPIPETAIHAMLRSDFVANGLDILGQYLGAQLRVALDSNKKEIPITCAMCNQYSEVYVPAPPGFWDQVAERRNKALIQLEQKHQAMKEQFKKESEDYLQLLDGVSLRLEELRLGKQIWQERIATLKTVLKTYETVPDGFEEEEVKMFDEMLFDELLIGARQNFGDKSEEEKLFTKGMLIGYLKYAEKQILQIGDENIGAEMLELEEKHASIVAEAEKVYNAGKKEAEKMVEEMHNQKLEELRADKAKLMQSLMQDVVLVNAAKESKEDEKAAKKHKEGVGTVQFFVCKNEFCMGAFCMRCESFTSKPEMDSHLCKVDHVEDLYNEVLSVLAEAATRKCPSCGCVGLKDLACTHITCDKCATRWCYHCEKTLAQLGNDFGRHNQWNINSADDAGVCPMYLQYKYGENRVGDRFDGDPGKALEKYHRMLQEKAIEKFQAKCDPNLWQEMITKKFPKGIFAVPGNQPINQENVAQVLNERDRAELEAQQRIQRLYGNPRMQGFGNEELFREFEAKRRENEPAQRRNKKCLVM